MNAKWSFIRVPVSKPLTPTQQALFDAIKASNVRVFNASAWNIRTITGLWQAGLIYWNCGPDSDYKQIALIKDAPAVEASPAPLPRVRAYRKENAAIMETTKRYLESNNAVLPAAESKPAEESSLVVTPLDTASNPRDLIGAFVQSGYFDDVQFRGELYIGEVIDVKKNGGIVWVLFQPIPGQRFNLGRKWRPMSAVKGSIYYAAAAVKAMAA